MIPFTKAHAYGNDFLYVHAKDVEGASLAGLARELCDRHTGAGADGLIVYAALGTEVSMRLLNADGSRAEVSGNGLRALGAVVLQDDDRPDAQLTIRTEAGSRPLIRLGRDRTRQTFRSFMGEPAGLRQLPPLEAGGETVALTVLNMGNPHAVIIGRLPDRGTFERVGAALERHDLFPEGTNIEFAEVETPSRIRVLIWERGVGPTNSSGTGSCAALVAAAAFGGSDREADVAAPGGTQRVDWRPDGVYLTGWAEVLYVGTWLRPLP
jgi:diaminopimelate epimerase